MTDLTLRKPSFGIDAPRLVLGFAVCGALLLALSPFAAERAGAVDLATSVRLTGAGMLVSALLMTASSRFGKPRLLRHMLDALALRGDERVLDIGCGRGCLLLEAAARLPHGRATGIDLWNLRDQSGNARAATLQNAAAAGLADRIDVDDGDMRRLPYGDARFDVIVSSLAIHNVPTVQERDAAVREIARVLKPGGRVALLDFRNTAAYARTLRDCGFGDVRRSWPDVRIFPPVRIVYASKPLA